ncbi:uncharacterized protein LOC122506092 [Leptopilina heterotoma]|uniref:uncharacterized protein LOC122506092 n=1 Tax=Leptopilina heterotoma TaxID=63436 RepID=UPI001CA9FEE0|nr:uncharacterized protein LOC122506092 [Leptopilina heterotoma]
MCHFFKHASTLFGTNQGDIWIREVQSKGPALFSFFEEEIIKNTQICKKRQDARKQMENIINEARMARKNLHCETPKIIALFCLLPQYFLEKETEVFHFLLDTSLPETVQSFENTERPVFIIKGKSFFDEEAKGEIFFEGEKIVEAKTYFKDFFTCFYRTIYMDIHTAKTVN